MVAWIGLHGQPSAEGSKYMGGPTYLRFCLSFVLSFVVRVVRFCIRHGRKVFFASHSRFLLLNQVFRIFVFSSLYFYPHQFHFSVTQSFFIIIGTTLLGFHLGIGGIPGGLRVLGPQPWDV